MTPVERDDMGSDIPVSPDLQLISDFMAKDAPPELVAEVRRRLDTDPAFKDFAAPLLATLEIPPHWQRHPMSREDVRKHWDAITRRRGFGHQKWARRRRRWTIFGIVAIALASLIAIYPRDVKWQYQSHEGFVALPDSGTGAMTLRNGARVRLDSAAGLQIRNSAPDDPVVTLQLLYGSGRFKLDWEPPAGKVARSILLMQGPVTIRTRGAEFVVWQNENDTQLRVIDRGRPLVDSTAEVVSVTDRSGQRHVVHAGERARIDRDGDVMVFPAEKQWPLAPITDTSRVVTLARGITAKLDRGAIVRDQMLRIPGSAQMVTLDGSAAFTFAPDTAIGPAAVQVLLIRTEGGLVAVAGGGIVKVDSRGDTTAVQVLARAQSAGGASTAATPRLVMLSPPEPTMSRLGQIVLMPGQRGRIVRGQKPERLP